MKRSKYFIFITVLLIILILAFTGCAKQAVKDETNNNDLGSNENVTDTKIDPEQIKGFEEYPIGDEQELEGLIIAAVYFQPVPMEPVGTGLSPDKSDIHIEADLSATPDNMTGYGIGDWVPYLTIKYKLKKLDDGQVIEGNFMPMNASDGPHYGANVKMLGAGKYELSYAIENPEKQGFLLHTDKETGVEGRFWKKPIEVKWDFNYIPRNW